MNKLEQFFIYCSLLCSGISKGGEWMVSKNPICSAQLREQEKNGRQRDREEQACSQVVSDTCYYVYCLHVRDSLQSPLFYSGKLFQQFVVDAWVNCKQRKLNWVRTHQHTLRSELYQRLQDAAMHDRHNGEDVRPLEYKLILFIWVVLGLWLSCSKML